MGGKLVMAAGICMMVLGTVCFVGIRTLLWVKKKRLMEEFDRIYGREE